MQRLIDRNETVLKSDLPLKEELKKVLGVTFEERNERVWNQYSLAKNKGLKIWQGDEKFDPAQDNFYKQMIHISNDSFWERKFDKIS